MKAYGWVDTHACVIQLDMAQYMKKMRLSRSFVQTKVSICQNKWSWPHGWYEDRTDKNIT